MSRLSPSSHNNAQQSKRQPVYGETRFRIWLCFPLAGKVFYEFMEKRVKNYCFAIYRGEGATVTSLVGRMNL